MPCRDWADIAKISAPLVFLLPLPKGRLPPGSAGRSGAGPRPIFAFSSASAMSEPVPASSALNFCCRVSPASSPPSSVEASASASIWSTFWAIRSKVSKALVSDSPRIVSWMAFWASARFCRAMRMFFLRLASSILSLSDAQLILELVDGVLLQLPLLAELALHLVVLVLAATAPPWPGRRRRRAPPASPCAPTPSTARSARPTASSAASRRRSTPPPASSPRPAGSACRATIWFSIFCGSSALLIRSFRLDLMSVPSLEKIPMVVSFYRSSGAGVSAGRAEVSGTGLG